MIKKLLFLVIAICPSSSFAFEVIAHRGVHQTYLRDGVENDTCTADLIFSPRHGFLENTISSISRAFDFGATIVELDVHPTKESNPSLNQIVVFHDWTLNCRTDASCLSGCNCNSKNECVTHQQSLDYLKTLDIGFGYTADSGITYPFRGKFRGQMPTFREVLDLMKKNPYWKILVNVKDKFASTQEILLKEILDYPIEIRRRILVEYSDEFAVRFNAIGVQPPI